MKESTVDFKSFSEQTIHNHMRVVFIGRDNSFNRKFISELFKDHELVCILIVEIDRFTFKG